MNAIKSVIGFYFNLLSVIFPKLAGKQSFYFFCIPFKAKLKEKQQAFLSTAEKNVLEVDDKKIQCYSWGGGEKTILFVHGWQSNSYRWKRYIDNIDFEEYRVIAFDAPGHGNSEGLYCNVPLYEKSLKVVCDHFGVPDSIISHSIGAFSSMYFLHKHKVTIEKFVSLASPFTAVQFVEVFKSELKLGERLEQQLKSYFKDYTQHEIEYFNLSNFARTIQSESLLIHDEDDESTPVENTKELHSLVDKSILYITKGYGHRLKSNEVIKKVHEFVTV